MSENNNYYSDKPISIKDEDKFQRYEFSKRIAQTIIDRKEEDCIVVGVYGAWGEGKTSIINFIEKELKSNQQVVPIKFNPWRYGNENSLLKQFFHQYATALDDTLTTKSEKAGELIKKYGKFINVDIPGVGNLGEAAQDIGEAMADVNIETLKERIEKIIKDNEKKIVVFIDDIDRLDKTEIYSIFRLVKLTADFKNTTYILSFDEDMVSSAIGDRFGSGNQQAGRNFLEKIVQVPLQIPVAQSGDLQLFFYNLVERAVNTNKIDISNDEIGRFSYQFSNNILPRLTTPRLAVRYSNSISFSLPLLYGEANMVDLMLIEAVKIFYPRYYDFIKAHPDFFLGNYNKKYKEERDEEKVKELKEHLNILNKDLSKKEQENVKALLIDLFPMFEIAFRNMGFGEHSYRKWIKEQRIGHGKYFNRYFSYSVIRGEVSDVAFQNFISDIAQQSIESIAKDINQIVKDSSPDNFLFKIRLMEDDFPWEIATKLAKAICTVSEVFPNHQDGFFMSFMSPQSQAAYFIKFLIKRTEDKAEQFKLAKELLAESKHFFFADELLFSLIRFDKEDKQMFDENQNSELTSIILKRALQKSDSTPLFIKFPLQAEYLLIQWKKENALLFQESMNKVFDDSPERIVDLIKCFTPTIKSTSHPEPYKTDLTRNKFDSLVSVIDGKLINELIEKNFKPEELAGDVIWTSRHGGLTDIILVKQFRHWYSQVESEAIAG